MQNKGVIGKLFYIFPIGKRGVSEIVSYVLLISITFAIAAIVYGWLMFYVTPAKEIKCEEGITLTIRSIAYNCTSKSLNMTLQNRGLFNIEGYRVRVNNKSGADIGVYTINMTGRVMNTSNGTSGGVVVDYYARANLTDVPYPGTGKPIAGILTFVEIQPYSIIDKEVVACDNIAKHTVTCA